MILRYAGRARRDISTILTYVEQRSPAGADHVRHGLTETFALILKHPNIGTRTADGLFVKTVAGLPYKVFYRLRPDTIDVLHVRHAARRPWSET